LPKKPKSAFNFFIKAKRREAEIELGENHTTVELKDALIKKWDELVNSGKDGKYTTLAADDKKRYEREMAEHQKKKSKK